MDVVVPGSRDVRATLDRPSTTPTDATPRADRGTDASSASDGAATTRRGACVVACPPHPQYGGTRHDSRLQAIAAAVRRRGAACLRFDYGAWDGGRGERTDARRAVAWARDRYDRVALTGYSFGGAIALAAPVVVPDDETDALAGPDRPAPPGVDAVSALLPTARLDRVDAVAALSRHDGPVQVIYGERDTTADWRPLVDRARALGAERIRVEGMAADHHLVGQRDRAAALVAAFLTAPLGLAPADGTDPPPG